MKLPTRLLPLCAGLIVILALGLFLSSCGGTTPNTPSTPPPASAVSDAASGAGASLSGTTTTWSCLTADTAGIFASAIGCEGINVSAQRRLAAAAAPGPSANLTGSVSGSTVTLNWVAPTSADPATSYIVEAGSSAGATNIAVFDTGSAATTLTVTGVPSGTYFVRVRAKNSAGSSAPSNEIVLTVGVSAPCIPGPPTGLSASVTAASVTFTWSAPAGSCSPISYNVDAGSAPGASDIARIAVAPAPTSFTANNIPAGTYYVRVSSGTPIGPGPVSNEVVFTIAGAPPSPGSVTGRWVGLVANGDGT